MPFLVKNIALKAAAKRKAYAYLERIIKHTLLTGMTMAGQAYKCGTFQEIAPYLAKALRSLRDEHRLIRHFDIIRVVRHPGEIYEVTFSMYPHFEGECLTGSARLHLVPPMVEAIDLMVMPVPPKTTPSSRQ